MSFSGTAVRKLVYSSVILIVSEVINIRAFHKWIIGFLIYVAEVLVLFFCENLNELLHVKILYSDKPLCCKIRSCRCLFPWATTALYEK